MIWIILCLNLATMAVAFKKRMILYGLLNGLFLFLVTGQAIQIQEDLRTERTVYYLNNFISDVGFSSAIWYVLAISCFALLLSLLSSGYRAHSQVKSAVTFQPSALFYVSLFSILSLVSFILIFMVVGLSEFLHSSRPGYQTGATIFLVLLFVGIIPLLLKLLFRSKVGLGDLICFSLSCVVTAAFSRIHLVLYLTAILLAFFYSSGWSDRPISLKLASAILVFGAIGSIAFFGIGALHDAQNFVSGSFTDLAAYILKNPEKSILSIDYNYRVGIEGMSGIAGAFSQQCSYPDSVHHDFGLSWLLQGSIQWLPGIIKDRTAGLTSFSEDLTWYTGSIVPTGAESFFISFGLVGCILYPLCVFLLSWQLPIKILTTKTSPLAGVVAYTLFACCIFFVRGNLPTWIAFSFSYLVVIIASWPFFRRYFREYPCEP
jgi:hypothetical protein